MSEVDASIVEALKVASAKASGNFSAKMEKKVIPGIEVMLADLAKEQPADPYWWMAERMVKRNLGKAAEFVETLVLQLKDGDFFGEIALLSDKPRQATVKANGKVTVMSISRGAFTRLCGNLVEILKRNMDTYATMEVLEDLPPPAPLSETTVEEPEVEPEPVPQNFHRQSKRRSAVFVEPVQIEANWKPPVIEKTPEESERLTSIMAGTALLGSLDQQATATVVGAFSKKVCPVGENIIQQGEDGDYFYLLDEGEADVFKTFKLGQDEQKVFEYSSGGSFGELALLHGEPRAATVRARTECKCWALDRDTFRKIMVTTGQRSMTNRTKFLDKVELLKELQPFEKFRIAEAMRMKTYVDQEVIIREGEEGNEFFIISEGKVNCYKNVLKF
mmetsp:Transcript_8439/g.21018  ORF Transcript_8439/g.21018 Transcript_8439/m.21018 type:complete len:390 (-) Transcript_8439:410-1579(-)